MKPPVETGGYDLSPAPAGEGTDTLVCAGACKAVHRKHSAAAAPAGAQTRVSVPHLSWLATPYRTIVSSRRGPVEMIVAWHSTSSSMNRT